MKNHKFFGAKMNVKRERERVIKSLQVETSFFIKPFGLTWTYMNFPFLEHLMVTLSLY
jgi:hypothetical protein